MSEKREQLESIATAAVQRGGLRNLSFRNLADQVGVKSSSVHYYFPEKSHLAAALIARYSAEFALALDAIDAEKKGVLKKLDAFVKLFEDALKNGKFCLCGMMAAEVESLDAANRAALGNYFLHTEEWLTGVVCAGQADSDARARVIARTILSGLEGAILIDRVSGQRQHVKAQRELIRLLVSEND